MDLIPRDAADFSELRSGITLVCSVATDPLVSEEDMHKVEVDVAGSVMCCCVSTGHPVAVVKQLSSPVFQSFQRLHCGARSN